MKTELNPQILEVLGSAYEIDMRQLFGRPAYFIGRSVFMCLYAGRIGLKLPPGEAEKAKASFAVMDFSTNGRAMPSWVGLELTSREDFERYGFLLQQAAEYAQQRQEAERSLS